MMDEGYACSGGGGGVGCNVLENTDCLSPICAVCTFSDEGFWLAMVAKSLL